MTEHIRLYAYSLGSKFGFQDGDILSEPLLDALGFDLWKDCGQHEILVDLVRERLLPLLPGVEVYELGTAHNPIRATDEWGDFCRDSDVFVDVPIADVVSLVQARVEAHKCANGASNLANNDLLRTDWPMGDPFDYMAFGKD
jgi:hypothetical protein